VEALDARVDDDLAPVVGERGEEVRERLAELLVANARRCCPS
jgi:hypothetical protein